MYASGGVSHIWLVIVADPPKILAQPNSLHNTHSTTLRPRNALKRKAGIGPPKQVLKLARRPLPRIKPGEHHKVHCWNNLLIPRILLARLRKAVVIDDDACTLFESRDEGMQHGEGIGVRLVVEDATEEIY